MGLRLKEYIGENFCEFMHQGVPMGQVHAPVETSKPLPESLMVTIEGIHASPFATRNYTRYLAPCLKKSVPLWTTPYKRPLIKHHNETDGEIIGRIHHAEYVEEGTASGTPALRFMVNVPSQSAKREIESGLLETVSIGVMASDVRCSICGARIDKGEYCEHERGQVYENATCYWDIYEMEPKELSYVIVPSDPLARTIAIQKVGEKGHAPLTESLEDIHIEEKGAEEAMNETTPIKDMEQEEGALSAITSLENRLKALEEMLTSAKDNENMLSEKVASLAERMNELSLEKESLEEEKKEEVALRESLQEVVLTAKKDAKESLVEAIMAMRLALNYPLIEEEELKSRTEDSLKDAISDLKRSIMEKTSLMVTSGMVENPTLQEEEQKGAEEEPRRVDLKEELFSIFNSVVDTHK